MLKIFRLILLSWYIIQLAPFHINLVILKMDPQMTEEQQNILLIGRLLQAIHQERCSPALLQFDSEVFSRLTARLKARRAEVEQFAERGTESRPGELNFLHSIYQLEVDRIAYLLKAYLRVRLAKVQQFALHLVKSPQLMMELSPAEQQFARSYAKLRFQEYEQHVLRDLHKDFRGLGGVENVLSKPTDRRKDANSKQTKVELRQPNRERFVFFRVFENPKQMRYNHDIHVSNVKHDDRPVIEKDDILFVPYSEIEFLFKNKLGELI